MQVYSGNVALPRQVDVVRAYGWGRMVSASHYRTPLADLPWAFDNGAYTAFRKGTKLDERKFVKQYARILDLSPPDFAVVPDIVGGGFASLQFSLSHVDTMWWECPSYLAVQDGMTLQDVKPILRFFDGIFVGGTCTSNTRGNHTHLPPQKGRSRGWKWDTAAGWIRLAHEHGMKCHIGKVGTWHDIIHAYHLGADSIDSTSWAVNDTHNVLIDAMTKVHHKRRRHELTSGYGRLEEHRICGELWDEDPALLGICRQPPGHPGEHEPQEFYLNGTPPILARDRGPMALLED